MAAWKKMRFGDTLWWLFPILFVAVVLFFFPFRFVFEFNPDEGLHLMRSLLQLRGYELYSDIFNDQPPLFTWLLSGLFAIFTPNVNLGRLFVLLLSTVLMLSALLYLHQSWAAPHVAFGGLLFLLLPKYIELSVSVMISLPAVAFAMSSFCALTLWHKNRSRPFLVLSAVALALSIMVKVFTGILVPIYVVGLLASEAQRKPEQPWQDVARPTITWALVFSLIVGVTALLGVGPRHLPQLFRVHLSALDADRYLQLRETHNINYVLQDARPILLLGILGAMIAVVRRKWSALYLLAWALLGYAGLSLVLPVWAHHQLLVTVPAAMLAAILLGELTRGVTGGLPGREGMLRRSTFSALGLLAAVAILGTRVPPFLSELNMRLPNLRYAVRPSDVQQYKILALMWKHAQETELVVTDRPMYAFRIKKPVPPELAVISEKRLWSGSITAGEIIEVIRTKQPEQVLLARFPLESVDAYLQEEYVPAYYLRRRRLFLRPDLASVAGDRLSAAARREDFTGLIGGPGARSQIDRGDGP